MRRRTILVTLALTACASGRMDEPAVDGGPTDAPKPDAAAPVDAPASSGGCTMAFTGTLATWSFAGETGNQTQTAVSTKANGVTAGAVTRAAGLTAVSGSGSINASGWPTSAQRDLTKYYTLTIAPPAGCTLALTGAALDARSSGTGPASAALATSVDSYAGAMTVSTTAAGGVAFTAMANGMLEVRVYGFAATAAGGTLRLQNTLSLTGSLQ